MQYSTKNKTITAARTTSVTYHQQQQLLLSPADTLRTHAPIQMHNPQRMKRESNSTSTERIPIFWGETKTLCCCCCCSCSMHWHIVSYTHIFEAARVQLHTERFFSTTTTTTRSLCVQIHTSFLCVFVVGCSRILSFSFSCIEPGVCMAVGWMEGDAYKRPSGFGVRSFKARSPSSKLVSSLESFALKQTRNTATFYVFVHIDRFEIVKQWPIEIYQVKVRHD